MSLPFQNLTEFNTAHNRRNIALSDLKDASNPLKRKHKSIYVSFSEDDEVINPGQWYLKNKFYIRSVHGIVNTSGLLQSKWSLKGSGFTLTLQETRLIHDSMNWPKFI